MRQPSVYECVWHVYVSFYVFAWLFFFSLYPHFAGYQEMQKKKVMVAMMNYKEAMIELKLNLDLHCLMHFLTMNQHLHMLLLLFLMCLTYSMCCVLTNSILI